MTVVDAQMYQITAGVAEGVAESLGVEGRAIMRHAAGDHILYGGRQTGDLRIGERADGRLRMDPGAVERFVGVDIAEAGDAFLVEQRGLRRQFRGCAERRADCRRIERVIQWFVAEIGESGC